MTLVSDISHYMHNNCNVYSEYSHFLSKLTIVVPTFNRQGFILRQLEYLCRFPVTLIIADGSDFPMSIPRKYYNEYFKLIYFHMPGAHTLRQRILRSIIHIHTQFACFLDDADFLLVSGLVRAISDLSDNDKASVAAGVVARAKNSNGKILFENDGQGTSSFGLNDIDPGKRITDLTRLMRTANLYYSVVKANLFCESAEKTFSESYSYASAYEMLFTGLLCIDAPFALAGYPFWIRTDVASVSQKLYATSRSGVHWYIKNREETHTMMNILEKELINAGSSSTQALDDADQFVLNHVNHSLNEFDLHYESMKNQRHSFKRSIKNIVCSVFRISRGINISHFLASLGHMLKTKSQLYCTSQSSNILMYAHSRYAGRGKSNALYFFRKRCGELDDDQIEDLRQIENLL